MKKKLLKNIINTLEIKKQCHEHIDTPISERDQIKLLGKIEATDEIIKYLKILYES